MNQRLTAPESAARSVAQTVGLAVAAALVGVGLGARSLSLATQLSTRPVDQLVELVVVTVGALVAWWFAISSSVAAACVVARLAGRGWSTGELLVARLAPLLVRRAVALTVAAGIGLGAATGAQAATSAPAPSAGASRVAAADDLGWPVSAPSATSRPAVATALASSPGLPSARPTSSPAPSTASPAAPPTAPPPAAVPAPHPGTDPDRVGTQAGIADPVAGTTHPGRVVVRTGDSLWEIASRALPAGASDAQIQAAWPAWYRANRATIGPDPDLIRPGQVLVDPQVSA